MRLRIALLCLALSSGAPGHAHAQSFFEKLFGLAPATRPVQPEPRPLPPPAVRPEPIAPRAEPARNAEQPDAERRRPTGRFRAVCVRLCDGYYWPMNDRATSQTLLEVADRCKSACGTEARLFYTEREEATDPSSMIDLAGRRYDALRTAFVYREKLISGCSCKPAPWSAAEQSRHAGYALAAMEAERARVAAAAAETARKEAEKNRLAGRTTTGPERVAHASEVAGDVPEDLHEAGEAPLAANATDATRESRESYMEPTYSGPTTSIAGFARVEGGRPRTIRVSHRSVEQRSRGGRAEMARPRPQRVAVSSQGGGAGFGLFGGGKTKYVWPGDR